MISLFLSLHMLGAHYTYALVPYDTWFGSLTSRTLNSLLGWERNNFDRLVHFCYGLLLAYPVREWDAQKDMAFASLGALLCVMVTAGLNLWFQRDFADEWNQSLRVKNPPAL